jgi:hypothetical protein
MVEFWACIGLGCMDREFLAALKEPARIGKSTVGEVVREYGFRLSYFELAELERLLSIPDIVTAMEKIYAWGCPPPLHCISCTRSARSDGYDEYRRLHASLLERSGEKA